MVHPPGRSRGWIWFFILLAGLVSVWIIGSLLFQRYYWGSPVTPERLAEARASWQMRGPRDYDYEVIREGTESSHIFVHVRGGQVVYAEPDPRPLAEKIRDYGVPALFDQIENDLQQNKRPGRPRTTTSVRFDPQDGHPVRYVHQVSATGEILRITVAHFQPCTGTAHP